MQSRNMRFLQRKKTEITTSEKSICFFRFASMDDKSSAQEALQKGSIVFLDVSGMQNLEAIRMKDYMQGVCASLSCDYKEICEDYIAYFPYDYKLQIFER